jgi:hypothetical protein
VRLTVTLGSQHSEPVPLKHAPDGVLNLARFLCHVIVHAAVCSLPPDITAVQWFALLLPVMAKLDCVKSFLLQNGFYVLSPQAVRSVEPMLGGSIRNWMIFIQF